MSVPIVNPQRPEEYGIHPMSSPELPVRAHVGRVRLAVSDLDASIRFYSDVIGLAVYERKTEEHPIARLGAHGDQRVLLELEQLPGVSGIDRRGRLGLYHTAFLLPTEEALSSFIQHLGRLDINFGSADHIYSQALYLVDPDGLTVEVYADRPQSLWVYKGRELVTATEPLQFANLPEVPVDSWQGAPPGTTVGHIHFFIGDLDVATRFYHAALGFNIMTWEFPGALFVSAGGYHHHVGLNTWAAQSPVATERDARLLYWELVLPDQLQVALAAENMASAGYAIEDLPFVGPVIVDPWGIRVALVTR